MDPLKKQTKPLPGVPANSNELGAVPGISSGTSGPSGSLLSLRSGTTTNERILSLSYNQDSSCFTVGTTDGFYIYNSSPLKTRFSRQLGEIQLIEALFKCNILIFVGGRTNQKYPPNRLIVWDDFQQKALAEITFVSEIKGLKIRRERIAVALESKVYLYNFLDLSLLRQIETFANPRGLLALNPGPDNIILACPGLKSGVVRLTTLELDPDSGRATGPPTLSSKGSTTQSEDSRAVQAHQNCLIHMVLSSDGTQLGTASERGTIIRIFNTTTGAMLHEFRRGSDGADIYTMAFAPSNDDLFLVGSNKGTIHLFDLSPHSEVLSGPNELKLTPEKKSTDSPKGTDGDIPIKVQSFNQGYFSHYFGGQSRSISQVSLPYPNDRYLCAFPPIQSGSYPDLISFTVITMRGLYYLCEYSRKTKTITIMEATSFL